MQRRTKVPVKKIPSIVEWILNNATGQELDYLDGLSRSPDFAVLTRLTGKFKDYNVYEVFTTLVKDADELNLLRAAKRGEVAAFDAFILACQAAKSEIKHRREAKV